MGRGTAHVGPTARRRLQVLALALVASGAALIVLTGQVHYTSADTRGTLLVAEQLIDSGTITLDAYPREYLDRHYNFITIEGRTYDYFPLGTSLVALPAVAVAKALGVDVFGYNAQLQTVIAALAAAAIVLLLYALARQFLPFTTSVLLAAGFWLATTLSSTGATALWSHVSAVVFGLLALLLLVRLTPRDGPPPSWGAPVLLGVVLFLAYLSRPTMALLAPFAIGYLATRSRRSAMLAVAALATLLAGFVLWSLSAYGSWLPPYYLPQRLGADRFAEALAGHVVSPSRGLLVYTPFLLMIPVLALLSPAQVRQRIGLLVVAVGWPLAHWIAVSRHPQWYGGFSYGPRLMTDILPGLFLTLVLVWPVSLSRWSTRVAAAVVGVLMAAGAWIHVVQGLHNRQTLIWNVAPRIEEYPEKALDWRYPQFLHTEEREAQRRIDYGLPPD